MAALCKSSTKVFMEVFTPINTTVLDLHSAAILIYWCLLLYNNCVPCN